MPNSSGVETKVTAASLSAAVSGAIIWALSTYAFKGNSVPDGLVSLIYVAIPAVCAYAAGWLAPHTPRPAPPPPAPPSNVTVTPPVA